MIKPALEGKAVNLLGRSDQPHTFTYVVDFGKLLATLGTNDSALGDIWFAPSNPPLTQAEFAELIEAELGRPVRTMLGGPLMMRFLGLFSRELRETVEMMYQWRHPYVVNTGKAQMAFGMQPTPIRQAIRETLAWLQTEKNAEAPVYRQVLPL
jgi:nucleoside-diphosphate-sugar epimerase